MFASVQSFWPPGRKAILFAVFGAAGCLLAAVVGEVFLFVTSRLAPRPREVQLVCLLIDCSGSMSPPKLSEVKAAATQFVRKQDFSIDRTAVVGFGRNATAAIGLSKDVGALERAIQGLADGGSTAMDKGFRAAAAQLNRSSGKRTILLFTDGQPDSEEVALLAAQAVRAEGIRIVAVGTGDAQIAYLGQLTGSSDLVFYAASGSFAEAFKRAERVIYGHQLVDSAETGDFGFGLGMLRVGAWTALLAVGVGLALIYSQNRYLKRGFLTPREWLVGTLGSGAVGLLAGAAGQILFSGTAQAAFLRAAGRIVAWTLLGSLLGRGMAFFVPNLSARRAWLGGALGGVAGGMCFLLGASTLGDMPGRLAGATLLGFCIGLMVALIEAAFRKAWLDLEYGRGEVSEVTLGVEPISIGADGRSCTILANGAAPIAVRYWFRDGKVHREDVTTGQVGEAPPNQRQQIGSLGVTVRTATEVEARPPGASILVAAVPTSMPPKPTPVQAPPAPLIRPPVVPPQPPPQPVAAIPVAKPAGDVCPKCGRKVPGAPGQRYCIIDDITF